MSPKRAFVSLVLLAGCAAAPPAPEGPRLAAPDGLALAFEDRGAGAPPLVLVHDWCGGREVWAEAAARLSERRRVVALDLGGHGDSGRDRERWTLEACARDVTAALEGLELEGAVLVGHGMGGPVALRAAALAPERVSGVIGVETLHQVDYPTPPELTAQLARSLERDFDASVERYVRASLPLELEPARAERLVRIARRTDRAAALALLREYAACDVRAPLRDCPVPVRCVNSARPVPTDLEALRRWRPDLELVLLERTGHVPMVEAPAALAAELEALLTGWPPATPR